MTARSLRSDIVDTRHDITVGVRADHRELFTRGAIEHDFEALTVGEIKCCQADVLYLGHFAHVDETVRSKKLLDVLGREGGPCNLRTIGEHRFRGATKPNCLFRFDHVDGRPVVGATSRSGSRLIAGGVRVVGRCVGRRRQKNGPRRPRN